MGTDTQSQTFDASSLDSTYALLRDARRRRVARALAEQNGRVSLRELAADVAARARRTDPDEVPAETVDRVALTLHHVHLPRLADGGVLAYETETNTVFPTRPGALISLLELVDADGR